jgi:hypothetical protein
MLEQDIREQPDRSGVLDGPGNVHGLGGVSMSDCPLARIRCVLRLFRNRWPPHLHPLRSMIFHALHRRTSSHLHKLSTGLQARRRTSGSAARPSRLSNRVTTRHCAVCALLCVNRARLVSFTQL